MFTLEQIKEAHNKVKSGADFPAYIGELKQLGVSRYETHVTDGHTVYSGSDGYKVAAPARYSPHAVSGQCNAASFTADLKAHQQGKIDFTAFCNSCAQNGVDKWEVDTAGMTCSYYDISGSEVLVEVIPG